MNKFLLACVVSSFASLVYADGVTSIASCTFVGHDSNSSTVSTLSQTGSSCSLGPQLGAGGGVSDLSLPVIGSPTTPVGATLNASSMAWPFYDPNFVHDYYEATANIDVSLNYTFTTAGPVRPGFIELTEPLVFTGAVGPGGDAPDVMRSGGSVGEISVDCDRQGCYSTPYLPGNTFAFTLGQNFTMQEYVSIHSSGFSSSTSSGLLEDGGGWIDLHFTLLEADGVTPVQILDAIPEPGTLGSLALAFCVCAAAFSRSRRRRGEYPDKDGRRY